MPGLPESLTATQDSTMHKDKTFFKASSLRKTGFLSPAPPATVDLTKVEKLQREGLGLRAIAARMGVCVNSVQRARGKIRSK
jgi:hypothetical protein